MGQTLTKPFPNNGSSNPTSPATTTQVTPWNTTRFFNTPLETLSNEHISLMAYLDKIPRRLKYAPENHSMFWTNYSNLEKRRLQKIALEAHITFLKSLKSGKTANFEAWLAKGEFHDFQTLYLAHQQLKDLIDGQIHAPPGRPAQGPHRLLTSRARGQLDTLVTKRERRIGRAMMRLYCPDPAAPVLRWEPVLRAWVHRCHTKPVQLYPRRWKDSADQIFDESSVAPLYDPSNGLFLHRRISQALRDGVLAIVPDVNPATPADALSTQEQKEASAELFRGWASRAVQDYRIVVVDPDHPTAGTRTEPFCVERGVQRLTDLDGCKLDFLTTFRPSVQCVFWVFLATVTVVSWRRKGQDVAGAEAIDGRIRNAVRYWGTPDSLITPQVLRSFVRTIGTAAEDLLNGDETAVDGFDDAGVAVVAMDQAYPDKEEDDYDQVWEDDLFKGLVEKEEENI